MMKDSVWLQLHDGSKQEIEETVAMCCPFIREAIASNMGTSKSCPLLLPSHVHPTALNSILDYCRFHQAPNRSDKERKTFNKRFLKELDDEKQLSLLTLAADLLQIDPLFDLTIDYFWKKMEGKSKDEIRDILNVLQLPGDDRFSKELDTMLDSIIGQKNKSKARQRKAVKSENVVVKVNHMDDPRPIKDPVFSITGPNEGPKKKKKNRKRKNSKKKISSKNSQASNPSSVDKNLSNECQALNPPSADKINISEKASVTAVESEIEDLQTSENRPESDIDSARQEEVDREVETAKRLLEVWFPPGKK